MKWDRSRAGISCFIVLILLPWLIISQEVPAISNIGNGEVHIQDQIWQFAEGCDGYIYAASSSGVLIFNGFTWELFRLPKNARVRSVYTGRDCRIYVGAYQTFGYLDVSQRADILYVSLADSIFENSEQEIWNIYGNEKGIVMQSFSEVWYYDFSSLQRYIPPTTIMLGNLVQDKFLIPQIGTGIYEFQDRRFHLLDIDHSLPANSRVAAIVETELEEQYLVATENHGVYFLEEGKMREIVNSLTAQLKLEQINRILRYDHQTYIVGTILNGMYVVDNQFRKLYHINKSLGLSNNTVLSLFRDSHGNVLVGLDKGMNRIGLNNKSLHYYDNQDAIGVIFDAKIHRGNLVLASNKGVFMKRASGEYGLVDQSQGQVWSFLEVEEGLLCGHNSGTFLLDERGVFNRISEITGGWDMVRLNRDLVLQSTYTGLVLLKRENGRWVFHSRIEGGNMLIDEFVLLGDLLVGLHPHFGIHEIHFSADFTQVISSQLHTYSDGQAIEPASTIFAVEDRIFIISPNKAYIFKSGLVKELDDSDLDGLSDESTCLLQTHQILSFGFPASAGRRLHRINDADGGNYMVVTQNGYSLTHPSQICAEVDSTDISIQYVKINSQEIQLAQIRDMQLQPNQNFLEVQLKKTNPFAAHDKIKFQLLNWSEEWLPLPQDGRIEIRNLNDGDFALNISAPGMHTKEILKFAIKPRWYESWIGIVVFTGAFAGLFLISAFVNKRKLQRKTAKYLREREKEMEAERLKHENEKLEKELMFKSQTLANDAMALIQKNHLLIEMRSLLSKHSQKDISRELKQKLLKLISKNLNSDEYWQIFEVNFNEVHEDFLNRFHDRHPQLTPGEKRLAAYIRMDLQSKEIAPLLNISTRSVENKRYRLRNRLGLQQDQNLKKYILNF